MSEFTVYDGATGAIRCNVTGPPFAVDGYVAAGFSIIEGIFYGNDYYIENEVAEPRPEIEASANKLSCFADGIDEIVVSNIPFGTKYEIFGAGSAEGFVDEDGTIELTFDTPGRYFLEFENFPYKPKQFVIEVLLES